MFSFKKLWTGDKRKSKDLIVTSFILKLFSFYTTTL